MLFLGAELEDVNHKDKTWRRKAIRVGCNERI